MNTSLHSFKDERILCVADIRGNLSRLNQLADKHNADYIIHTGEFGFYDYSSLDRMTESTLRQWIQSSSLFPSQTRSRLLNYASNTLFDTMKHSPHTILSELTDFLSGVKRLNVPVYTVWDSMEDVEIVKKFSSKQCHIPNLFLLDENSSHLLDIGGVYLRLFGLGGAVDPSKVRSLIELARSVWDPSETIVLISYASPRKERALGYLASVLYADFTISGSFHSHYVAAYNLYARQSEIYYKLIQSQNSFMQLWEYINQVDYDDDSGMDLLNYILFKDEKRDKLAYKNTWHFNLSDATDGSLVFSISQGIISTQITSNGLNFSHRNNK